MVAVSALLIAGVWALCLRLEGRSWADEGLVPDGRRLGQFVAGLAGGVALVGGLAWLLMLGGVLYWQPNQSFTAPLMASGTAYFVAAVLVEELIFRGYALRRLAEGIGAIKAVVLLAAIFGGYHLRRSSAATTCSASVRARPSRAAAPNCSGPPPGR
ncbi:CPBP family intramembrane metalloprotease [Micromonospora sp. DR5-3]|uniref:CPBP family intramembrane glutamic endopeptidase n=1 Tax=unclassified Micromonospora TaxID=2617518 RepID=UPI001CA36B00|nr:MULTISPECIES: type II CAAX endopeptidase family protein [unclassified Micromonospora]MCW3819790.1 CPBP family intramembrane metalloprotease [Micromonospora sp. DR5-3]